MITRFIYIVTALLFYVSALHGQSAKKHYKTGVDFFESKNYEAAIEQYTKALDMKPDYDEAYLERGRARVELGKLSEAIQDFEKASVYLEKDERLFSYLGKAFYLSGDHEKAMENLNKAIDIKKSYEHPYIVKYNILMDQKKYKEAVDVMDFLILLENEDINWYRKAKAYELMGKRDLAEKDYEKSVKRNRKFVKGYVALANIFIEKDDIEEANDQLEIAFRFEENNREARLVKSKIFVHRMDYPRAIDEVSKIILLHPEDQELFLIRGIYYQQFMQHQNAINDFNKVLLLNKENAEAYFHRAYSYEQVADYKSAIENYKKAASLSDESNLKAKKFLEKANERLFELNRENNNPEIVLLHPEEQEDKIVNMPKNAIEVTLRGLIKDESPVRYIKINGQEVQFLAADDGFEFVSKINVENKNSFTVVSEDVYDNKISSTFLIKFTEINPPKIVIRAPVASDNGEIMLDNYDPDIYIEGEIKDESEIKSIYIDGVIASFSINQLNPSFNATISVANKNKVTIVAEDIHGNKNESVYTFNREMAATLADNPMGKTWVIFIENSNYQTFASLEGPIKDVTLMRSALVKYKVNKIVHKKDMTKTEMERFFSIELRDLVRANKVNSLMIWYAGHGKFINETGYWIPVDAKRDDEFTYFNISTLKAALQTYEKFVTHTLIVTDACESGPTFYQAMRSTPVVKTCDDWQAVKFKSSQVFSSAGYELAVDNSQFTKTFASTLANNPNACIPIDKIVTTVTNAVGRNNKQKPKFGKISGMGDEDGTFFFMSK